MSTRYVILWVALAAFCAAEEAPPPRVPIQLPPIKIEVPVKQDQFDKFLQDKTLLHLRDDNRLAPPAFNQITGGGNFTNGETGKDVPLQYGILKQFGAKMCRFNIYPGVYLEKNNWDRPNPAALDKAMLQAHNAGVTPMILFEYYTSYYKDIKFGTKEQWFKIGQAFAKRFGPEGDFWIEHKITGCGVRIYTAMNEPEPTEFRKGGSLGPAPYKEALEGLADGVHSVNARLKVNPGGFMAANAWKDYTLRGLGPEIAPLYNNGKLDALDLHTYYDVKYAPMEGNYKSSAQSNFDEIKKACGITCDINFCSTEFNYKRRAVSEEEAAKGFLTGIFDNFGVIKADGVSSACQFAFPWNLFHEAARDTEYGMCVAREPYAPDLRARVFKMVLSLTGGMVLISFDPKKSGEYVFCDTGKMLWVWQNRKGWTDHPGTSFTLHNIPKELRKIEVYGWDGLRRSVELKPGADSTLIIGELAPEETYLFLGLAQNQIPRNTEK